MDRNAGALYAVAAGVVLIFYMGIYRNATVRMQIDRTATARDRAIVSEDRLILQRSASIRALQYRVDDVIHSPVRGGSYGDDEAGFLERLRRLSRRYNVTIISLVQGPPGPPDRDAALFKGRPLRISATGKFAPVLQFLGSLGSTVGLFDIERIEMQPLPATKPNAKTGVRVRLDGLSIRINQVKGR